MHPEGMITAKPVRQLSLLDSTSLIVGIIIGVGIYQMAPEIAHGAGSGWGVVALWALGGLISLGGALCYAELASAYPQAGGDYVYFGRAYGSWAGFLFGWAQLAIVRPGDIAVIAFAFATYARAIYDPLAGTAFPYAQEAYAVTATIVLTCINVLGVRQGKWTQNLLTAAKVLGLLLLAAAALLARPAAAPVEKAGPLPFSLALIFVLFTYGGWNEVAYVAAEIRDPRRSIWRALVAGIGTVTLLYLLVNGAFLRALGYEGLAASKAVAADAMQSVWSGAGGVFISGLICVSALGALNGLILTGARISYALGADHRLFHRLGRWHPRLGTPAVALVLQGAIAVTLLVLLGSFVNAVLYTAATVYSFYLASALAVIVLRFKEPSVERPCRVLGYPLVPLAFAGVCAFLIYSAVVYRPAIAAVSGVLLLLGLPLWCWSRRLGPPSANAGTRTPART